jgi:hypothetical protein
MVSEPLEEMTDRPTPETDEFASMWRTHQEWKIHARHIERQRDDALEQLAAMTDQRDAALMAIRLAQRTAGED